ncbi:N-acetylneuraminate synthase family protein [Maribellus maritimus]|uniref:N-acetylneuraminate synthase family protein n=1 Tax=Maribellus maritimus TaxID=2870838 RepID=UPI001EEB929D|nr:N-acetylneuraminate synthase family protein [Maribellus maritimus]MCG6191219.1 N-acetylneuraminate synthase family protein [Maribellus maritimus]
MSIKTIAETAWHHDGDFNFMKLLVDDLIQNTNTNFIKLHITLSFNEYMLPDHPGYDFLVSKAFNKEQWQVLIEKIVDSEKKLMLLFNDIEAIDFGMSFNPELVEIHSVCLNDLHLLKKLKEYNHRNIPIILGVGGSTLYEIENAISFIETENIVLMHGFQNYPTKYSDINFKRIRKIMGLYPNLKHGYADHTAWNEPNNNLITVMGAALGMDFVEKHVTNKPGEERTDWQAAIGIKQFNDIVTNLKLLDSCNGDGLLKLNEGEIKYSIFGPNKKAAFLNRNIKNGETFQEADIDFKRTSQISDTSQTEVWNLVGKKAIMNYPKGELITKDKFE